MPDRCPFRLTLLLPGDDEAVMIEQCIRDAGHPDPAIHFFEYGGYWIQETLNRTETRNADHRPST